MINKDGEDDWWKGELNGKVGLFPKNYVQPLDHLKSSEHASQCKQQYMYNKVNVFMELLLLLLLLLIGSEMLEADVLAKIPSDQKKRQEAIFELIHSEKAYVHSLNLVKEVGVVGVVSCYGCGFRCFSFQWRTHQYYHLVRYNRLLLIGRSLLNATHLSLSMSINIVHVHTSVLVQCFKMYLTFFPPLSLLSLSLLSLSLLSLSSLSPLSLSLLSLSSLSLSPLSLSPLSLLSISLLSLSLLSLSQSIIH